MHRDDSNHGWIFLDFCCCVWAGESVAGYCATDCSCFGREKAGIFGKLDGKALFSAKTGALGYTAEYRATQMSERIELLAKDISIPLESIRISEVEGRSEVYAGERLIFAVSDEDAKLAGRPKQELAQEYAKKVQAAVAQYRIDYSRRQILIGVGMTVLLSVLLVLLFLVLQRLRLKIIRRADARIRAFYPEIFQEVHAQRLMESFTALLNLFRFVLVFVVFLLYLQAVLAVLPWSGPVAGRILDYMMIPLSTLGHGFTAQIPNLFFLLVLAVITHYAVKLLRLVFNLIEVGRIPITGFDPEWARPTFNIVRIIAYAFTLVVAFPYIPGSSSPAFQGVSVFVGVLFSLGSSSAIANVIAGLSLTYRRAYRVEDRIRIGDVIGEVTAIRLTVTNIRTPKNELVTIPNSQIVNSNVINYSTLAKEKGLILHTEVTIGYDTPWRQLHALLLMAAERTPGILRNPRPFILERELQDFYIRYELNAYTNEPENMLRMYSILHENIQDAFNEYGVQIMSPNYEADPEGRKFVPKEEWYKAPAVPE